jgi:hypothetical protein
VARSPLRKTFPCFECGLIVFQNLEALRETERVYRLVVNEGDRLFDEMPIKFFDETSIYRGFCCVVRWETHGRSLEGMLCE